MKKILAMIMAAVMLLSVCGCSVTPTPTEPGTTPATTPVTTVPTETTAPTEATEGSLQYNGEIPAVDTFSAGFARKEILPEESVPIAGLGRSTSRMSTSVHDTLFVSCFAITDENNETVLMFSVDLQRPDVGIFNSVRSVLEMTTGIPEEHIYFTATHTHSGPDTYSSHASIGPYEQKVVKQTLQTAYEAIADRKPATMAYSSIETEGMNFVKHYKHTTSDGTVKYFGDNYGTQVIDATTTHATEADTTLHVVHFQREGGKDLIMANWRAHPHLFTSSTSYKISADYPGAFRTAMENMYDCYFAYFQGAAGNMNSGSRINSEEKTQEYGEYGKILAEYVIEAMKTETVATDTAIQTRQTMQELEQNHLEDHLTAQAALVTAAWNAGATYAEAVAKDTTKSIHSPYHASAITSKASKGKSFESELNAIAIGDALCVVTAPHELFDTNSAWLEENSPYTLTLTFGYTNGMNGYVPSAACWEYGSYEVDCTNTVPGTGELIQETFLTMLKDMKG